MWQRGERRTAVYLAVIVAFRRIIWRPTDFAFHDGLRTYLVGGTKKTSFKPIHEIASITLRIRSPLSARSSRAASATSGIVVTSNVSRISVSIELKNCTRQT